MMDGARRTPRDGGGPVDDARRSGRPRGRRNAMVEAAFAEEDEFGEQPPTGGRRRGGPDDFALDERGYDPLDRGSPLDPADLDARSIDDDAPFDELGADALDDEFAPRRRGARSARGEASDDLSPPRASRRQARRDETPATAAGAAGERRSSGGWTAIGMFASVLWFAGVAAYTIGNYRIPVDDFDTFSQALSALGPTAWLMTIVTMMAPLGLVWLTVAIGKRLDAATQAARAPIAGGGLDGGALDAGGLDVGGLDAAADRAGRLLADLEQSVLAAEERLDAVGRRIEREAAAMARLSESVEADADRVSTAMRALAAPQTNPDATSAFAEAVADALAARAPRSERDAERPAADPFETASRDERAAAYDDMRSARSPREIDPRSAAPRFEETERDDEYAPRAERRGHETARDDEEHVRGERRGGGEDQTRRGADEDQTRRGADSSRSARRGVPEADDYEPTPRSGRRGRGRDRGDEPLESDLTASIDPSDPRTRAVHEPPYETPNFDEPYDDDPLDQTEAATTPHAARREREPGLDWDKLVRAANFPDSEDDRETLDALYAVLTDPEAAALLQSAEDALSSLAELGLYMEDVKPDHAPIESWRLFIVEGDETAASDLAGVRDPQAVDDVAAALRQDGGFSDVADRFVERYEAMVERLFAEAPAPSMAVELADSRTGRAYMLIGRAAGHFG